MSVHGHRSKKTLVRLGMEVGLCERGVSEVMGAGMSSMVLGANMNALAPGTQAEGRLPAGSFLEPLLANHLFFPTSRFLSITHNYPSYCVLSYVRCLCSVSPAGL